MAQTSDDDLQKSKPVSPSYAALEWPGDRAFPSLPDVAQTIDVADLTKASRDEQALLTSLQGVVNRKQPRLYLYWEDDGSNKAWLEQIRQHIGTKDWSATPLRLLDKYRGEIKGAIAYDERVPDTVNLATTIAGYRDCVITSDAVAGAHGLPVVQNLQGMFKNKQEVYLYGLSKVYPYVTKRLIAAIPPRSGESGVNSILRDYIVALAAPCIWLDPENSAELHLLEQILKTLDANSVYLGWFPHGHEMTGITVTSKESVHVVASDFYFSGSLMSGLKKLFPATSRPVASQIKSWPTGNVANKIYVSLTWSEGDNIQYCQRHLRHLWNHPMRGRIPMGWTITPLLADIGPNILNYFQTTATENDALVVGPSGAGYTNPISWPYHNFKLFLNQTKRYLDETGFGSNIWVYNRINGQTKTLSSELATAYQNVLGPDLLGISVGAWENTRSPYAVKFVEGLPAAGMLQIDNAERGLKDLNTLSKSEFDGRRPLFVACSLTAWNFNVGDMVDMVGKLGPEFEIVRPDEQFKMIRMVN
ncbi:hypothetical protein PRZ48_012428 [Zasmidium cellare]|uniref:Uncharacterized protein n=1 Tax=Zasmidium cellare TaxID=395010 RepID=A0ABR0E5A7_ZASCE|nr:hypothetical protein PRZ48_012428 [Zasmidium cellare]